MLSHESDVERAKRTKTCVNFRKQWEGEVHKTGKEKGKKKKQHERIKEILCLSGAVSTVGKKARKKCFEGRTQRSSTSEKKKKKIRSIWTFTKQNQKKKQDQLQFCVGGTIETVKRYYYL